MEWKKTLLQISSVNGITFIPLATSPWTSSLFQEEISLLIAFTTDLDKLLMDHMLLTDGSIKTNQLLMDLFTNYTPTDSIFSTMDGTSAGKPIKDYKTEPSIELMKMLKKPSNYTIWFHPLSSTEEKIDLDLDLIIEDSNMTHQTTMLPVTTIPVLFPLPLNMTIILLYGMSLIFISMNIPYGNHLDSGLSNF